MAEAKLIQICYDLSQKRHCYEWADIYFNQKLTVFFENEIIKELVLLATVDKIAICSWKLKEKMRWNVGKRIEVTQDVINSDYEVLSFTKNTKHHQMLAAAERWHPGFTKILKEILNRIGKKMPSEVKNPIYQNHFSAKTEIYRDYVTTYLVPAMEVMNYHQDVKEMCMIDSNYSNLTRNKAANLKNIIGIDYYPMHPFLLERLFSIYCHNNKINVSTI